MAKALWIIEFREFSWPKVAFSLSHLSKLQPPKSNQIENYESWKTTCQRLPSRKRSTKKYMDLLGHSDIAWPNINLPPVKPRLPTMETTEIVIVKIKHRDSIKILSNGYISSFGSFQHHLTQLQPSDSKIKSPNNGAHRGHKIQIRADGSSQNTFRGSLSNLKTIRHHLIVLQSAAFPAGHNWVH